MSETFRAQCNSAGGDYITAEVAGEKVELNAFNHHEYVMNAFVTVDNARTFARGILALADEIDCGETVAETPTVTETAPLKVGDKLRVTKDDVNFASVRVGDILTVNSVSGEAFTTDDKTGENGGDWYFSAEDIGNGLERIDEPALTISPEREALFRRAADLVKAVGARPDDPDAIVRAARFLAGE